MRYILCLLLVSTIIVSQQNSTHAAATFTITNVTKFAHLPLKRSATLETVMGTIQERVYMENIERQGSLGTIRTAPADLLTVMAAIDERIILENIENTGVTTIVAAPAALLTVMQSMNLVFMSKTSSNSWSTRSRSSSSPVEFPLGRWCGRLHLQMSPPRLQHTHRSRLRRRQM